MKKKSFIAALKLYSLLPLSVGLLFLEHQIKASPGIHQILELAIVLLIFKLAEEWTFKNPVELLEKTPTNPHMLS